MRARCIRHLVPTSARPALKEPHHRTRRQDCADDDGWPHQYLRQPNPPLNFDDALLGVPNSGQLAHASTNAHDQRRENRDNLESVATPPTSNCAMTFARPALLLLTGVLLAGCSAEQTAPPAPQATAPLPTSVAATPLPVATATVTVTAPPSSTAQAAPTTPAQSAPTTPGQCGGEGLAVTAGAAESVDTQRRVTVSFKNVSSQPCTLVGYPGADLVTPAGGVLISVARRPANAAPHLTLDPGETATADVMSAATDTSSGKACARWGTLVVTAPNDVVPHTLGVDLPICDATVSSVG